MCIVFGSLTVSKAWRGLWQCVLRPINADGQNLHPSLLQVFSTLLKALSVTPKKENAWAVGGHPLKREILVIVIDIISLPRKVDIRGNSVCFRSYPAPIDEIHNAPEAVVN